MLSTTKDDAEYNPNIKQLTVSYINNGELIEIFPCVMDLLLEIVPNILLYN